MISNLSMPQIHELLDLIPSPCVVFDLAPFSWPEAVSQVQRAAISFRPSYLVDFINNEPLTRSHVPHTEL